jgi:hypothetical protein
MANEHSGVNNYSFLSQAFFRESARRGAMLDSVRNPSGALP